MFSWKKCYSAIAAGLLITAGIGRAGEAISFVTPTTNYTNGTWSLGWEFNVTTAINVTHLGFYDSFMDDLTQSHDVGIFNSVGVLLVSGTVNPGDPLLGWFRYTDVPDLVLGVGTGYRIAAATRSEDYTWDPLLVSVDPRITYVTTRETYSGTLVFPVNLDGGVHSYGIFGPNFQIDGQNKIPEPSTVVLLGLGAVGMIVGTYRRRRPA